MFRLDPYQRGWADGPQLVRLPFSSVHNSSCSDLTSHNRYRSRDQYVISENTLPYLYSFTVEEAKVLNDGQMWLDYQLSAASVVCPVVTSGFKSLTYCKQWYWGKQRGCKQTNEFLCHLNLFCRKQQLTSSQAQSPSLHLQELAVGIDDVSLNPTVDLWACSPLGARHWQSIIRGHNTFSPVSQALIVIQVPWSSRGRRRAVLSYLSWLAKRCMI